MKTGSGKELPPQDAEGWFYKRTASIARHVYLKKDVGVGALRKKFGGSVNKGARPSHHRDAAGSINRKALQGLEKLGVLELSETGGRRITENGQRDLDRIAVELYATLYEEDDE